MERADRAPVATFFAPERPAVGASVTLGEDTAHHARVRRIEVGARLRLLDGDGTVACGTLVRLGRSHLVVEVDEARSVPPAPAVHLLVPVADRDRMLWLAEKAAELGVSSWRPVVWRRSRSVSPRGEGKMFRAKVRARMTAALEQSGNAWLPTLFPEASLDNAIAAAPAGTRLFLDPGAVPALGHPLRAPIFIALGPEGGAEAEERALLERAGWTAVTLADNILRFETAGVVALGIARAALGRAMGEGDA